jgi:hypothetical protein
MKHKYTSRELKQAQQVKKGTARRPNDHIETQLCILKAVDTQERSIGSRVQFPKLFLFFSP